MLGYAFWQIGITTGDFGDGHNRASIQGTAYVLDEDGDIVTYLTGEEVREQYGLVIIQQGGETPATLRTAFEDGMRIAYDDENLVIHWIFEAVGVGD